MSYGTMGGGVGSYYMLQGLGGMRRNRPLAAFGGYGSLGALFYDGGKAYWTVAPGGEIVSSIAQKVYGNASVWVQICKANPQGRDPQQPAGDCWYKPGTILELPLVPGYPDPASSAPQSGLPTVTAGTTIVTSSGKVATVGTGGKITSGGAATATAAMSTGTKIGIAVAALALVGGMALLAKKKKGAPGSAAPHSGTRPTAAYAANRRRRRRR